MVPGDKQTFYTAFKAVQADFWIRSSSITIPQSHLEKKIKNQHTCATRAEIPEMLRSIRRDIWSVTSPPLELLGFHRGVGGECCDSGVVATKSFTCSGTKPSFKTPTQHVPCQYRHSKPSLCGCLWVRLRSKCYSEHLGCRTEIFRQLVRICLRLRFEFVQVQPVPLNLWPHLFTLLQKSTARSNS